MPPAILYCSDPLRPRRVDAHFAAEANTVRELGGQVALIDHDALLAGRAEDAVAGVPTGLGPAWYRGWMIPADRYAELADAAEHRGTELLTTPAKYRSAHTFPGWYEPLAQFTPVSVWRMMAANVTASDLVLEELVARLPAGAGIVKDFVKSRKDEPDASLVTDLGDAAELRAVVGRFIERQGSDLAGGIVLRHFESFEQVDGRTAELRTWWLDGKNVLTGPHPDSPAPSGQPDLDGFADAVRRLPCRFITCDVARRTDGAWRIIEVGDGQVSDFPAGIDTSPVLEALLAATE